MPIKEYQERLKIEKQKLNSNPNKEEIIRLRLENCSDTISRKKWLENKIKIARLEK